MTKQKRFKTKFHLNYEDGTSKNISISLHADNISQAVRKTGNLLMASLAAKGDTRYFKSYYETFEC